MKELHYLFDLFALWVTVIVLTILLTALALWLSGSDTVSLWVMWGTLAWGVIASIYRMVEYWRE